MSPKDRREGARLCPDHAQLRYVCTNSLVYLVTPSETHHPQSHHFEVSRWGRGPLVHWYTGRGLALGSNVYIPCLCFAESAMR